MDWLHCRRESWEAMGYANSSSMTSIAEVCRFLRLCVLCRWPMRQTISTPSIFWIPGGRLLPTAPAEVHLDRSSPTSMCYHSLEGKVFRPTASTESPLVFL